MNRIVVPAANIDRAVESCRELLGFEIREPTSLRREAELEHQDTIITLTETRDRNLVSALLHRAFEVESVAPATAYLELARAAMSPPRSASPIQMDTS